MLIADPIVRLVVCVLAVYRLASMMATEDGPLYVFAHTRRTLGLWAAHGNPRGLASRARVSLVEGVSCPLCLGVWLAALALPLVAWPSPAGDLVLVWLGIAGAQAWLQRRM